MDVDLAGRIRDLGLQGSLGEDVSLSGLTSYQIGGPAEILVEPASIDDVEKVVSATRGVGAPLTVIGAGSNVLVSDEGLEGVVLRVGARMGGIAIDGGLITAGAGASDRDLARSAARAGITGFEFLEDIPGTLGGGLVQNAEAWGDAISDHLVEVTVVDATGAVVTHPVQELEFGYRDSTFKRAGDLVIVEARFAPADRAEPSVIVGRMDELRTRRHARYPLDLPSCGSVFKRPEGDYAGRLIEVAELGGTCVGGACVSRRHHNFIVNRGKATARDVRALVELVQERVLQRFGVQLERELVYLGSA